MKVPMIWNAPDDDFWREARDLGARFHLARKRLIYKQRAYCTYDGRLVAAVVDGAPVLGEPGRYLWIVGGHVGQVAEMRDDYEGGAQWAEQQAAGHSDSQAGDFRRRWADGLRRQAVGLENGRDVPALAYPMHDKPDMEYDAPCWKCHRDTRVILDRGTLRLKA